MWESYKRIEVEAKDLESAVYLALKQFLEEPDDTYMDDSFGIDNIIAVDYPDETFNIWDVKSQLYQ